MRSGWRPGGTPGLPVHGPGGRGRGPRATPAPGRRTSKFPEEGGFGEEDGTGTLRHGTREPENHFVGVGEPELRVRLAGCRTLRAKPRRQRAAPRRPRSGASPAPGLHVHPLTGRLLDPSSPLALALSARDRALKESSRAPKGGPKAGLNKPLYIDTKCGPVGKRASLRLAGRAGGGPCGRRQREQVRGRPGAGERRDDKKGVLVSMRGRVPAEVSRAADGPHGQTAARPEDFLQEEDESRPGNAARSSAIRGAEGAPKLKVLSRPPQARARGRPRHRAGRTIVAAGSMEAVILPFHPSASGVRGPGRGFYFSQSHCLLLEFANSFDIPDDRVASVPALSG